MDMSPCLSQFTGNCTAPSRPVLRYHGSKWRLAKWIISYFPSHKVYVEPFGGGASVLLRKAPVSQEVYNDLDEEIVNVFRVLREPSQAEKLRHLLYYTPHSRSEYDLSFEPATCSIEAARRTIVRSFMGYGSAAVTGQYKSGFRGKRAGSAGPALEWSRYEAVIPEFVTRLRSVTMECASALEIIDRYDAVGTLFYVDPPYVWDTRTTHGASYRHEMTEDNHIELAGVLHSLSGMVILSGYGCELYDRLYADWLVAQKETRASSNAKRLEQLWISPNAQAALPQQLLMESV